MAELVLAGQFPAVDREQWAAAVAAALDRRGELSPDAALARLRTTTYDGITLKPLYTPADAPGADVAGFPGASPFVRGRTAACTRVGGWDVRQRVDAAAGAGRAVEELERGATSVLLDLRGVREVTADLVGTALEGVMLDVAPVVLDAGGRWQAAAEAVGEHLNAGSLGADPSGSTARPTSRSSSTASPRWITHLGEGRPDLRVVTIDGTRFHDAGASDAQQLGCTVAAGVEYLRALDRRGVAPAAAIARIELRLAATDDQFATIAMFRAVRRLWARVAEAVGAPGITSPIHAVTSRAMMTAYDPWVNALRSTVACFAGGIAGADAVTVLPHDHLRGPEATELGRRIARNTQSILLLESHLDDVIDPAGGSWYVERFTDELADAAWAWCQEIEAAGGFRAAGSARGRAHRRDTRARAATTSTPAGRRSPASPSSPTSPRGCRRAVPAAGDGPLAPRRWSEDFEALRRARGRGDAAGTARCSSPRSDRRRSSRRGPRSPRTCSRSPVWARRTARSATIPPRSPPPSPRRAPRSPASARATPSTASSAPPSPRRSPPPALAPSTSPAVPKAIAPTSRTIHVGVDVRATLAELLDLLQVP